MMATASSSHGSQETRFWVNRIDKLPGVRPVSCYRLAEGETALEWA
jgi:hypothetical protein